VAVVRLAPAALQDLERLVAFLREGDPVAAGETATLIFKGLRILEEHPLIGRPLHINRRELVIHRGRTGYLVQYHYDMSSDEVVVLAVRPQREVDG
jgi:plasmid stabilization system protein ParE